MALPGRPSEASRDRLELARRLANMCPPELGVEIAVTGSVSRGVADEESDIELNLWVNRLPTVEQRAAWLTEAGCTDLVSGVHLEQDGFSWSTCRLGNIWMEIGWGEIDRFDRLIRGIAAGEVMEAGARLTAWTVQHAIPLREAGFLARWRHEVGSYPPGLAARIIKDNTEAWSDPHVPGVRLALARRGQLFALAMRMQWDVQNLLHVLWAINGQWDQDWKWIDDRSLMMPIKPDRLADRINELFVLTDPVKSARDDLTLILEGLALVPPEYDVSAATRSVRAALQRE